jgi:hypothetical protein
MKQLIKVSFLFIMLFLTIPAFAEGGDMGAGGNTGTTGSVKVAQPTQITRNVDSINPEEDASDSLFSWVYEQIFELID